MELFLQFVVNGVAVGSLYGMLALGFGVIYSVTGILHLSHGAIFSLIGYSVWFLVTSGLPLALAGMLAALVGVAAGVVNYWLIYRPLRQRGVLNFGLFVASLSFAILIENLIAIATQSAPRFLASGVPTGTWTLGGITITGLQIASVIGLLLTGGCYLAILRLTRLGLNIQAVAGNPEMARVVGIGVERTHLVAFALGSAMAAPAAIIVGYSIGLTPYFGTIFVIKAIIGTILGGIGSFLGPAAGALILGVFENISIWFIPTEWQLSLTFGLVFLIMVFRPYGLWGSGLMQRELR